MELSYLVKLTLAVYRVTQKIPKEEPLRYKIRELADQILEEIAKNNNPSPSLVSKIHLIQAFFDIAQQENWLDPLNFQILKREYQKILKNLKTETPPKTFSNSLIQNQSSKEVIITPPPKQFAGKNIKVKPSFRQQKILDLLKQNKQITLSQLRNLFPQVSGRTLRRDMENFLKAGIISRKRMGRKDVLYILKE